MCWYLDRESFAPIQTPEYIFGIEKVPEVDFIRMCRAMADDLCAAESQGRPPEVQKDRANKQNRTPCPRVQKQPIHDGQQYRQMSEPGTRHQMMCDIAVHQRYGGMDKEACRACLVGWYEKQDQRFITSSQEEVMEDVGKIVEWVYGDNFRMGNCYGWRGEGVLSKGDMLHIIRQPTRSMRKVCFLVFARIRANCAPVSYREMAQVLGMSKQTVLNAIRRLIAEGVLMAKTGNRWATGGGFKSQPMIFEIDEARLSKDDSAATIIRAEEM